MFSSPTVREAFSSESFCLEALIDSKVTDAVLIIGAVAMIIIGSLAASGIFTFMSQTNALYLSYGMFGGATFCILAEAAKIIFKLIRNRCRRSEELTPLELEHKMHQIKKIVFEDVCLKSRPCQHSCIITFKNGKRIERGLGGDKAFVLIEAVGSEKCFFDDSDRSDTPFEHFSSYSFFTEKLTVDKVLKKIFG